MNIRNIVLFFIFVLLYAMTVCKTAHCQKINDEKNNKILKQFDTLTQVELADFINTRRIYEPETFMLNINDTSFEIDILKEAGYKVLSRIQGEFDKASAMVSSLISNRSKGESLKQFSTDRLKIASQLVRTQEILVTIVDKNISKTNNKLLHACEINTPIQDDFEERKRYLELAKSFILDIPMTKANRQEFEQYRKQIHDRIVTKNMMDINYFEYSLQTSLLNQQKKTLLKTHPYLVKLYSLEPRADGELLELLSESKYPEPEKVKILLELKIPYKDFRHWESQDRKFRTIAKFISLDKNKNKAVLEKPNGQRTLARVYRLRFADAKYIRELTTPQPVAQPTPQPTTNEKPKP
jgi:hypothetical protein